MCIHHNMPSPASTKLLNVFVRELINNDLSFMLKMYNQYSISRHYYRRFLCTNNNWSYYKSIITRYKDPSQHYNLTCGRFIYSNYTVYKDLYVNNITISHLLLPFFSVNNRFILRVCKTSRYIIYGLIRLKT